MNKYLIVFIFLISFSGNAQDVFGQWITVDDETKEKKSIVEIFKRDGKVFGKIIEIFDASKRDLPCVFCNGIDYNKPILGLEIIKNMKKDDEYYRKGTVINPENGKTYKLRLALDNDNNDILQVRGYIGFFYQTQYWERVMR
ncbi:DUF2147 domain-containing protein [Lacinutrix sp. Bg11-31]|uniref:DUF2147 domain-containing protein n=1 Tax=Lacinutrix sp. Bg11-31 TaxID=2057808 RepID=UPI000C314D46|nr:DUF2147 domain-containing protein [Lacinutrix sp. Bg11-31]AUC81055.1 DUF2147 domain-containing protein [Lacinutrix sp. Bg11-31]